MLRSGRVITGLRVASLRLIMSTIAIIVFHSRCWFTKSPTTVWSQRWCGRRPGCWRRGHIPFVIANKTKRNKTKTISYRQMSIVALLKLLSWISLKQCGRYGWDFWEVEFLTHQSSGQSSGTFVIRVIGKFEFERQIACLLITITNFVLWVIQQSDMQNRISIKMHF